MRGRSASHTPRSVGGSLAACPAANSSAKLRNCASARVCDAYASAHRKRCAAATSSPPAALPHLLALSCSSAAVADS